MENKNLLGLWRHYKGNVYEVIGIGTHSETLLPMVIYRSVKRSDEIWVRPLPMWEETVTVNGVTQTRFTRIESN
jgi:hypothetical protein